MPYTFVQLPRPAKSEFTGIRVYKTVLRITASLYKIMKKPPYVSIYTDKKNKAIALRPNEAEQEHYRKVYSGKTINCRVDEGLNDNTYIFKEKKNGLYICTIEEKRNRQSTKCTA